MLSNNKILVSACLCGEKCRYNGSSVSNNVVDTLEQKNIIKIGIAFIYFYFYI